MGRRGSLGGAADEAGGQYRRAVAALFAAQGLNGLPLEGLPVGGKEATVQGVALETDFSIDDILVRLQSGRLFLQAKRSLDFGRSLREVTKQWLDAVRAPDFEPATDFLGGASGAVSEPVHALATALNRLRQGAKTLSRAEGTALERMRELLKSQGATPAEIHIIVSRAVLLQLHVEETWHEHAERGRLLLDGHVVTKGEGARAWRELVSIAGAAARLRVGHTIEAWLAELRRREVPLTADAEASRSAYLQRRHEAVSRYRETLRYRGERVDLTTLGARLPPIPLSEMDAGIPVRDPTSDERDTHSLLWSFRRRGRVLLTGLPGGGKSTAVAAAVAAWARREHWALPVMASLRRIAEKERFRKRPLRDDLLDVAVDVLEPADRPLVREVLDEALNTGHAALFLDGLDEAADRSLELASDIAQLLRDVHPETDVLVATRDVAYADAQVLGFRDIRLGAPSSASKAIEAVLRAAATHLGLTDEADVWVAKRLDWVERSLGLDRQLSETPLMPVLLSLLAAERETEELPRTRSLILERIIQDVVRRKELKRELRLPSIPPEHAADAIVSAFPTIASVLTRTGGAAPRAQVVEELAIHLQHDWGFAPAVSRATAKDIMVFWDDSGIFVASGAEAIVAPRLRLFLEIGAALHAASLPREEAVAWVEEKAASKELRETLILAAGLSQVIADALINRGCRGTGELDEVMALAAADALGQGGTASEDKVRALAHRILPLVTPGDDEAWKVFQKIVQLPVPIDLQEAVLGSLRHAFGADHVVVGAALAALEWDWPQDQRDRHLEQGLRVRELARLKRRRPRKNRYATLADVSVDQPFMRVKEEAAALLLPSRPDLAPLVAQAMEHASSAVVTALDNILRRNGHAELATTVLRERLFRYSRYATEKFALSVKQMDEDVRDALEIMAKLSEPATLPLGQERRLEELASFIETLNLNSTSAWLSGEALRQLGREWFGLIAVLGGFDAAVLAAEARVVQREMALEEKHSHAPFYSLFDGAEGVELRHWERVPSPGEGRELALRLLHAPFGLAIVAAQALATHPAEDETAAAISGVLSNLPREAKRPAVWAYLHLIRDVGAAAIHLATSKDEAVREAVATLIPLAPDGRPTSLGRRLAMDSGRTVRLAVLEQFEKAYGSPTPELVTLLEEMAASEDTGFTCHSCGTWNESARDSCSSCSVVTWKPSEEARELLDRLRPGPFRPDE